MRGMIAGLVNPHPLEYEIPSVFQSEDFTRRFVSAFDEVVAPLLLVLDNQDAYLDPALTPADFLPWLAGWVGLELDENWSERQQRRMITTTVDVYGWRGTRRGIVELLRTYADVDTDAIEVTDSGGVSWSPTPGGDVPGQAPPTLSVRVRVDDPAAVDRARIDRLVAAAKPAHVAHDVEVVAT